MVDLGEVMSGAGELLDRVAATEDWDRRFDVVDEILARNLEEQPIDPTLAEEWRQLVGSGG
ncbi:MULTISPECIES: hypothetical protein [unclassified Rhodococcus (in: high G+C Gram-positive bacteria)]|uniref:hypothetical protein n=1 Tax=unclassified Rhodococcus (in: high G+C Gram-positive bacteria) TaxID=192944 RepID=UPI001FF97737|nr:MULTISPECIES: hypothetical protein [unclassified Rhodococcus (in: high G+C Gram-positive bacteria)]